MKKKKKNLNREIYEPGGIQVVVIIPSLSYSQAHHPLDPATGAESARSERRSDSYCCHSTAWKDRNAQHGTCKACRARSWRLNELAAPFFA
jgi:hypothetical protein